MSANDDQFAKTVTAHGSCAPSPGSASRAHDGGVICDLCGCECEWEECHAGCEDGYFFGYEEDPLWYDEGDLVPCNECRGQGGSYWCETKDCPTAEVRTIKRMPNGGDMARLPAQQTLKEKP